VDGFDCGTDAGSRREVHQQRASVILFEVKLDPGIHAHDVDAGHSRRQTLVFNDEPPLIEEIEPRLQDCRRDGMWQGCIHGVYADDVFVT